MTAISAGTMQLSVPVLSAALGVLILGEEIESSLFALAVLGGGLGHVNGQGGKAQTTNSHNR